MSARRIWISVPGKSFTNCSASADTTRSSEPSANGKASSSAATHNARIARPGRRRGGNDGRDLAAVGEHAAHRVGRRAEIDRALELAQHHRKPLAQFGGDPVDQEGFGPERAGALLARAQQPAIEDGRV